MPRQRPAWKKIARLGAAMARAVHALHQQNTVHLDLKPANVLFRGDGSAVLLDFGLSCHAHYPDLLAEQLRKAVGSPAWIAPEQVVGVRGDPRSDIFAMGVMLYQLCTGEPALWRAPNRRRAAPAPVGGPGSAAQAQAPAARVAAGGGDALPGARGRQRYPSAAHLAFDLTHPAAGHRHRARAQQCHRHPFRTHFKRWLKAAGMHYKPSPMPSQQIEEVPIVMVAVPHKDVSPTPRCTRCAKRGALPGHAPRCALACVTVISPSQTSASDEEKSETSVHRRYLSTLRQWAQPLDHPGHQTSYHVLESGDVAQACWTMPWQPRQRHRHGCRHPRPENPALCGHGAHQGGHGRTLHRHPGQAGPAL
jgi:serine/threonine protein kinase